MEDSHSGRPPREAYHIVRDPEQARLLSDTVSLDYFEPFIARELTVSEAAREAGCALDTMLYRVRKFLEAGLLVVTRSEPRAGRPIKYYRSSADAYFVPFDVTPFTDLEERLADTFATRQKQIATSLAGMMREHGWVGVRIYRHATGEVWRDAAADVASEFVPEAPDFPAVVQTSMDVYMNRDEAKALQLELSAILKRFQSERKDRTRQRYSLDIAFVPLEPD